MLHPPEPGLEQLYRELLAELRQFARKRLGDIAEAEDVVQEAFMRFQRREDAAQISNPRPYLYTTVAHLVIDRVRQRKREGFGNQDQAQLNEDQPLSEEQIDARTPEIYASAREELTRVVDAVSHLPPQSRRAFLLHKVEHLTYAQIAAEMGITKSAVEKLMMRAMRQLGAQLRKTDGGKDDD